MQTNPNWQAYFIITDPSPFEKRLEEILLSFNDPRLVYFDVDLAHRPVVRALLANLLHFYKMPALRCHFVSNVHILLLHFTFSLLPSTRATPRLTSCWTI